MKVRKILHNDGIKKKRILYFNIGEDDFAVCGSSRDSYEIIGMPLSDRQFDSSRERLDYLKSATTEACPPYPVLIEEVEIPKSIAQKFLKADEDAYETDGDDPSFDKKLKKSDELGKELFKAAGFI